MTADPLRSSTSLPDLHETPSRQLDLVPDFVQDEDETGLPLSVLAGSALFGLILGAAATTGVIIARRHRNQ